MSKPIPLLLLFLCLISCDSIIEIKSANEPKDDQSALALVGIDYNSSMVVKYRDFVAGMDDYMTMVITIPKNKLQSFMNSSSWSEADFKRLKQEGKDASSLDKPGLTKNDSPLWNNWAESKEGLWAEITLPNVKYAKIYIALDQDKDLAVVYINWFET